MVKEAACWLSVLLPCPAYRYVDIMATLVDAVLL